jgi:small-conductance mechanosensitive channel
VAKWLRGLVQRLTGGDEPQNVSILLGKVTQWTIAVIGLLVALMILVPSFELTSLVAVLGLSGIAIGFAFKDIFQNFLAGILILLTNPFRVGDQIAVGDFEGTVEAIQTRATFLKTYDGRRVVIPNAELYNEKVIVNTAFGNRRSEYDVGIGYGDDDARAGELMIEAARRVEGVLGAPAPEALMVALADSTVNLRLRWWTDPTRAEVIHIQDRVLRAVQTALTEEGIDMPFPTQVLLFHDQTEATDGNRSEQREGWPAGGGDVPEPARIGMAIRQAGENGNGSGDGKPVRRQASGG